MNLMERIQEQIRTDDEDTEKQSSKLMDIYAATDEKGRALIDDVMMTLCGWRLATLIDPPWEE